MGTKRYNLSYLKEISGGDEEFILDMVQTFIENTPLEIATLRNYAKEERWEQLGENAHRFAPSLQFLGVVSLRPVINQLEDFSFSKKNLDQISTLLDKLDTECILVSEELKKDFNL